MQVINKRYIPESIVHNGEVYKRNNYLSGLYNMNKKIEYNGFVFVHVLNDVSKNIHDKIKPSKWVFSIK
jgi:hypothetical protein